MSPSALRIASAVLESPHTGTIELSGDWTGRGKPRLKLAEEPFEFARVVPMPDFQFGFEAGFFVNPRNAVFFCFDPARHPGCDWQSRGVYLAASFNGWQAAVGVEQWRLRPETVGGREILVWVGPSGPVLAEPNHEFKFVSGDHHWFEVPHDAPNAALDPAHNRNYRLTPHKTGRHRFTFELAHPLDLSFEHRVVLSMGGTESAVDLQPGKFFFDLKTDLPLGAIVGARGTTFRLFAPRARWVKVGVFANPRAPETIAWHELRRRADGSWDITLPEDLHGQYYWYRLDGPRGRFSAFDPEADVLDPYALAVVDRGGPGIVLDPERLAVERRYFKTPPWHDLVVVEGHVRDLLANSPVIVDPVEKRTFAGLVKWVDHRNCYLKRLGANAIELQPVQEFDNATPEEYGWGYMPVAWFAPESSYGRDPERASQVVEFQEAVEAFHRNGIAVLLDVVYNHVGEPNHLQRIDKLYYFETAADGSLLNWSGCGNDLRCASAMARRLIVDSLAHLVRFYGVDGFRFDLADLLGLEALQEIEYALKRVRSDIVLVAEPWSYRGHIAAQLRDTGFASWNDGYRNHVREYVHGRGSGASAEYFLRGSPWHFARWPAQTVNYTESHDDRTWIDTITENPGNDGFAPTVDDLRRTHLMAAFLMASIGIPMLAAGQDFVRSKHGVHNTYRRGDLNALDYRRIPHFPGTHAYFAAWIRFRQGPWGRLLRHYARPAEGFLAFFHAPDSNALAVIYNANGGLGPMRMMFAINPHKHDLVVPLGTHAAIAWVQVADHERFFGEGEAGSDLVGDDGVFLPGLGCGLWVAGG